MAPLNTTAQLLVSQHSMGQTGHHNSGRQPPNVRQDQCLVLTHQLKCGNLHRTTSGNALRSTSSKGRVHALSLQPAQTTTTAQSLSRTMCHQQSYCSSAKSSINERHMSQCSYIEQHTQRQSEDSLWHHQRRLRHTASNFGRVAKRRPTTPVGNLVKSLLYSKRFCTEAT